jgi:hypothetical protein
LANGLRALNTIIGRANIYLLKVKLAVATQSFTRKRDHQATDRSDLNILYLHWRCIVAYEVSCYMSAFAKKFCAFVQ